MYNVQFKIVKLVLLLFAFYILYSTFYITPVYAQVDSIGQARIHPASPLYFLKSVREILELKFAGTTNVKAFHQLEFSERRLREINSLLSVSRQDLIHPTLEKYWLHLQELTGLIHPKDEKLVTEVTQSAVSQMNALQEFYAQSTNQQARMSLRTAIYRLSEWENQLISKINLLHPAKISDITNSRLSACAFLEKEASSSALNEVERGVYAKRAQKCLMIEK